MQTRHLALRIPHLRSQLAARLQPRLAGTAFAIVSGPGGRAQILGLSSEASMLGLRAGMTVQSALKQFPDLQRIEEASGLLEDSQLQITRLLGEHSPDIRYLGAASWLLDISGLQHIYPDELEHARLLLDVLKTKEALDAACGIGSTPLSARLLSRRASCGDVHAAEGRQERKLLDGFPLAGLPGLPAPLLHELAEAGIRRVAEARQLEAPELLRVFGASGRRLLETLESLGCPRPGKASQISRLQAQRRLSRDSSDPALLWSTLSELLEEILLEGRARNRQPSRLTLRLGWSDGHNLQRGMRLKLSETECLRSSLRHATRKLLSQALDSRRFRVRELELQAQTEEAKSQLSFFAPREKSREERLDRCIHQLRGRYGRQKLQVGFGQWTVAG